MVVDEWIAIALGSQIRASSSNPVIVNDHAVALWRSASGEVNAWEDRCPHRGMRLSFGFVDGEQLRCIYHGWGYAPSGQCVVIPAHPGLTPPKTICANRHAVESRYGVIWTNLATDPRAPLPDLGPDEGWEAVRSIFLSLPLAEARKAVSDALADEHETASADGVVTVDLKDDTRLAAAFQPIGAAATGVHFVVRGAGATVEGRHELARRVVQLRHQIEDR